MSSTPQIRSQRFLADPELASPCGCFPLDGLGQFGRGALAAPADPDLPQVVGRSPKPARQFGAPGHV